MAGFETAALGQPRRPYRGLCYRNARVTQCSSKTARGAIVLSVVQTEESAGRQAPARR